MKLKTRLSLFAVVGIGIAALTSPVWTSESGSGGGHPAKTEGRKTVTFTIEVTPTSNDFGPQVVGYAWVVGPANGSGVVTKFPAVIDTRRGRRGELVHLEAWGKLDRGSGMAANHLDAEALYGGRPFGIPCSVAPKISHCVITTHVPAVD